MRYPEKHKQETRERVVRAAARLFRRQGVRAVSIDRIMEATGLTRGGFYRHFESKAALYREVIASEHDFIERLRARDAAEPRALARAGRRIASDYLAPAHRRQVIRGCTLASLVMDTARGGGAEQRRYADALRELLAELGRGLPDAEPLDDRALTAAIACIGGLLLGSASAADEELSRALARVADGVVVRALDPGA
jgi:TetR/AcrR family transcriptional repressor of nem operon